MTDVDAGGDGDYLDPLRQTPFTGLKYLTQIDDGTWEYMLSPGSQGYGLMVWSMAKSCSSCGDYVPQWLLPVLCHWTSVVDPATSLIHETVADPFSDTMRVGDYKAGTAMVVNVPWGPMIGIQSLEVPEQYECFHYSYTVAGNVAFSDDDCEGGSCEGDETAFGPIIGLVPVLSVIPIDVEQYARWRIQLAKAWHVQDEVFGMYGHCACDHESWYYDLDEENAEGCLVKQMFFDNGHTEVWNDEELRTEMWAAEANCECAYHSFMSDWSAVIDESPTFVDEVDDDLGEAWDYLLDRYFTGWKWLEQHTPNSRTQVTERNLWLTYFSRRFSPFWGPTGLQDYLRTHAIEQYAA